MQHTIKQKSNIGYPVIIKIQFSIKSMQQALNYNVTVI